MLLFSFTTIVTCFRWNSYYDAMKCVLINIDKINELCIDLQLPSISSPREVSFLKEYCEVYYYFFYVLLLI